MLLFIVNIKHILMIIDHLSSFIEAVWCLAQISLCAQRFHRRNNKRCIKLLDHIFKKVPFCFTQLGSCNTGVRVNFAQRDAYRSRKKSISLYIIDEPTERELNSSYLWEQGPIIKSTMRTKCTHVYAIALEAWAKTSGQHRTEIFLCG